MQSFPTTRKEEEQYLLKTIQVVKANIERYTGEVAQLSADIEEMLEHYHDNDPEVYTILNNSVTLNEHMKRALLRNEKALKKPYFGRIDFEDIALGKKESLYIGKGGIAKDATHWMVVDWRAPVANVYYENGLGRCSYPVPDGKRRQIDLRLKRTYEVEGDQLLDYYDSEVVANDELLTKYLAKNKQAVLGEIIATIQKEQNDIIRKSPFHNVLVQGVAGSGKTTVAMHRISYILYNYENDFKPDDFYIVGSNRILLNYITGVLPDLDVYGIRQMTMEQLFTRLLYEEWDSKKHNIADNGSSPADSAVKGTLDWFKQLERYCDAWEWRRIDRHPVYLNRRQFVERFRDGTSDVFDESDGKRDPEDCVLLMSRESIEDYIRENPSVSTQNKLLMLQERLQMKVKNHLHEKTAVFTALERKAIQKHYRSYFHAKEKLPSVYELYADFLQKQQAAGEKVTEPAEGYDVYDLAALAYLYKRIKEQETIREAHHVVIDEAQDFGMMAYASLEFCLRGCTYTVMGDVSQNIHFGCGLNDWEQLKKLLLSGDRDSFGVLKKSYRNTVEISDFATRILRHGSFAIYPVEPIIRHGNPVQTIDVTRLPGNPSLLDCLAEQLEKWQQMGMDTIAVVCRDKEDAVRVSEQLEKRIPILDADPETAQFGSGILVLPVEYTKGLEFDAVLIYDPKRDQYPVDDGHAKLLYVAATRALHELVVLHGGNLTGLIADPPRQELQSLGLREEKPAAVVTHQPASKPVRADTRPKISLRQTESVHPVETPVSKSPSQNKPIPKAAPGILHPTVFGELPSNELLRPMGHARIDLSCKWVTKETDGVYFQSRYGVLRLSPVGSGILRITFCKNGRPAEKWHPAIAVRRLERMWTYREQNNEVELTTDEMCVRVDKLTGAICYMTREKKVLLSERKKECRQIELLPSGKTRCYLYLDRDKKETLYGFDMVEQKALELKGNARYITGRNGQSLPFLLSDRGYGLIVASGGDTFVCDIGTFGSYLCTDTNGDLDYYFVVGKNQNVIRSAYGYLLGKH